ncbi:growth arrest and DNA damage-inducible proteins-interacting protein 1 [Ostrinia furnacalis]|uniref:growth arrest and DNA damage-inducible proteins-interacting protein 1 n=1 Tax=Ostrinia furnacalis TaxID=93504 RepID=UPI0010392667|nr:growth arrest and DNA damage-inducible proteins-interacting protein 1 [Ostrinia furnacalis]
MNLCLRNRFRPNLLNSFIRFATTTNLPESIEQNEQVLIDDSDEALAREAEIEKKRNVSRLSAAHFNQINDRRPYDEPKHLAHLTVKYHRKLYGKYGSLSGVNPSLCWPSKKDIQEKLEYESVTFPFTIKEMMDAAAEKRRAEQEVIDKREKELAAKITKVAAWKKDLQDKLAKKMADAQAAKVKKERLVDEVRRHFGFTLDPRDERFQEMLAKREKEQKKLEKMARKEAKEKQMIAKLQQKNAELEK